MGMWFSMLSEDNVRRIKKRVNSGQRVATEDVKSLIQIAEAYYQNQAEMKTYEPRYVDSYDSIGSGSLSHWDE